MYTDTGLSESNFQFTGKPGANHYHMGIIQTSGTSEQKLDTPENNQLYMTFAGYHIILNNPSDT